MQHGRAVIPFSPLPRRRRAGRVVGGRRGRPAGARRAVRRARSWRAQTNRRFPRQRHGLSSDGRRGAHHGARGAGDARGRLPRAPSAAHLSRAGRLRGVLLCNVRQAGGDLSAADGAGGRPPAGGGRRRRDALLCERAHGERRGAQPRGRVRARGGARSLSRGGDERFGQRLLRPVRDEGGVSRRTETVQGALPHLLREHPSAAIFRPWYGRRRITWKNA